MVGKGSPSNKGRGSISGVNAVLKAKNGACTPSGKLSKKDPLNKGHLYKEHLVLPHTNTLPSNKGSY